MSKIRLLSTIFAMLIVAFANAQPPCPPATPALTVDFKWSPSPGTGNELPRPAAHGTVSTVYTVNGNTVTVTVRDPNNRMAINNYTADPLIATQGPYSFTYTQTNGSVGNPATDQALYNNYLQLGMFSATSSDKVEVEYLFSVPVYLCNFEISDIDADGSGSSTPGTNFISYQDEVDVVASTGSNPNVPVSITKAFPDDTRVIITGQNLLAEWPGDFNNDVAASSGLGKVFLSTSAPITKLIISYSNGPQDDGASNDHHIRLSGALASIFTSNIPVNIIAFDARNVNGQAVANLTVANQVNVDRYELQHSADGATFNTVNTVRATAATQYGFTHAQPVNGSNYYRIKTVDRNGAISYSTIVKVDIISKNNYLVFSQGSGHVLQANTSSAKKISVAVHNASGAIVARQDYQLNAGANQVNLGMLANQPGGLYFVSVTENGARVFSTKLTK